MRTSGLVAVATIGALGTALALFNSMSPAEAQASSVSTAQHSDHVGACPAATPRGIYVVRFNGQGTSAAPQFSESDFYPITVIGTFNFGDNGVVSRSLTVSVADKPPFPVADQGSYHIASDCSGTIEFPSNSETFTIYIVDEHRMEITATTDGRLGAGVLLKQEIHDCSNESLTGTFVFTVNGVAASALFGIGTPPSSNLDAYFPVAVVGNWIVDGTGGVTRSLELNFGGSAFPYADHGSYQIDSDCIGSAFFSGDDELFKMIFVNSRTIVIGVVSTDAPGRHGVAMLERRGR